MLDLRLWELLRALTKELLGFGIWANDSWRIRLFVATMLLAMFVADEIADCTMVFLLWMRDVVYISCYCNCFRVLLDSSNYPKSWPWCSIG